MISYTREGPSAPPSRTDWRVEHSYKVHCLARYSAGRLFWQTALFGFATSALWYLLLHVVSVNHGVVVAISTAVLRFATYFFVSFNALSVVAAVGRMAKDWWGDEEGPRPNDIDGAMRRTKTSLIERPRSVTQQRLQSPKLAAYLLQLILPIERRTDIIGDLEENFNLDLLPRFGVKAAVFWYWVQAIREVAFCFGSWFKKPSTLGTAAAIVLAKWQLGTILTLIHELLSKMR